MLHLWLHFSSYIRPSEAKRENTMEPKHWNAWKTIRNKVWYTTEWSFLSASSASRPWKDLTWTNIHKLRWQVFGFVWPPTPLCWQFRPYESWHFWTTYPPLLQTVVCERPLLAYIHPGNALARVQRVHEPVDLWDITFCTRIFWGPELSSTKKDCTRSSKFLTHTLGPTSPSPWSLYLPRMETFCFLIAMCEIFFIFRKILKVQCIYF